MNHTIAEDAHALSQVAKSVPMCSPQGVSNVRTHVERSTVAPATLRFVDRCSECIAPRHLARWLIFRSAMATVFKNRIECIAVGGRLSDGAKLPRVEDIRRLHFAMGSSDLHLVRSKLIDCD
jgi:hypothetical protein